MKLFEKENWFISPTDTHQELTHTQMDLTFKFSLSATEDEIFSILPAFEYFYNLGINSGKKQKLQEIKTVLEIK